LQNTIIVVKDLLQFLKNRIDIGLLHSLKADDLKPRNGYALIMMGKAHGY
jgi:hypothetical protein